MFFSICKKKTTHKTLDWSRAIRQKLDEWDGEWKLDLFRSWDEISCFFFVFCLQQLFPHWEETERNFCNVIKYDLIEAEVFFGEEIKCCVLNVETHFLEKPQKWLERDWITVLTWKMHSTMWNETLQAQRKFIKMSKHLHKTKTAANCSASS